ncbi:hypothetical protein BVY03_00515 [bacterium K02(2017)]|nr:hypothetical protein BVY03_00515 [bacterium K02(2017)]
MIVDDSKSIRKFLQKIIESYPQFEVVFQANNANEALNYLRTDKPDVITLDINMPGMDGVSLLKKYMPKTPIPTIMITSLNKSDSKQVLEALEYGAFDYIQKPHINNINTMKETLKRTIIAAFQTKNNITNINTTISSIDKINTPSNQLNRHIIAIGASTGGTEAIKDVLSRLPINIPPIVIVQHIPAEFSASFANRLDEMCPFQVLEAKNGDMLKAGHVFIAPGGRQMKLETKNGKTLIKITDDNAVNRFKPSVDYLFSSLTKLNCQNIIGILMTGMGSDGAQGLLELKKMGATTWTQNEQSCIVFGMPRVAIEIGASQKTIALENISREIIRLLNSKGQHENLRMEARL